MGWHEERFEQSGKKIRFDCVSCSRQMFFPPSKLGKYKTCSEECRLAESTKAKEARRRECATCKKVFYPRTTQINDGIGLYCSSKCFTHIRVKASLTPEARSKRLESYMANLNAGKFKHPTGEDHPKWKGGLKAHLQRRRESGKSAETLRQYRKNNPEKVKEFTLRRKSRKFGRLPKGTISRLGAAQRWKCVVCKCDISSAYHVDHITPLAKGGKHEPTNIQLLCPTCNVKKSDKDPIRFMQERGFLL